MLAKIRHFVTCIALADLLLALMYSYLVRFCPILKSHKRFENYLKKPFQLSNFHGLEMTKDWRCLCKSHKPFNQAPVNLWLIRFHVLLPLIPSRHCVDDCTHKQPFYTLSKNIHIYLINGHLLGFQGCQSCHVRNTNIRSKMDWTLYVSFCHCKMKVFIKNAYHLGHSDTLLIHWKVTGDIWWHHRKQLGQYCERIVERETLDVTTW